MEKQGVLQFDIDGEYLTSIAREWFYVEGKGYDKCIELLNGCMSGTDETKEQIRRHAEDLLLGRAALKGSTREGSYHLEIYGPESEEKMPEYMNVWDIVGEQKKVKDELERYKMRWNVAMKMIPRYLKEKIGIELEEDLTEPEPIVSGVLNNYMKRMLDTEEHTTEDYGWLEPDGKFHAVEWGVKRGWVLLHNPAQGVAFTTKDPTKPYTKAQKEFLYDYYIERNCEKEANDIWKE